MSSHCPRIVLQRDVTLQDIVTLAGALGGKLLKRCGWAGVDLSDGNGRRDIRFRTGQARGNDVSFKLDANGNFTSALETVWLWVGEDLFDASTPLRIQAIDHPPFTPEEVAAIVAAAATAFGARPSAIHNRLEATGTKMRSLDELNANSDADINDFVLFDFNAAVAKFTRPDPSGIFAERRFECWMCQSWHPSWDFTIDVNRGGMDDEIDLTFVTVLGRRVYQPRTACDSCVRNFGTETRPQKRKHAAVVPHSKGATFVLEVVRFVQVRDMEAERVNSNFVHVGYMDARFRTAADAVSYYDRHNPHMRSLMDGTGKLQSDWDPQTNLAYIVRADHHLHMSEIPPFDLANSRPAGLAQKFLK